MGTTLGKTLAVKLSLRDPGGNAEDCGTPLTCPDNPLSPIHTGYYNVYLQIPPLLRKPTPRTKEGCR
jgi:hypothetical protein